MDYSTIVQVLLYVVGMLTIACFMAIIAAFGSSTPNDVWKRHE